MSEHPLTATFRRLAALNPHLDLRLGQPDEPTWLCAETILFADQPLLSALLARRQAQYPQLRPTVIAISCFNHWLWLVTGAALPALLTEQRIPDLRHANVALHFDMTGRANGLALVGGRFAALETDTALAHPDADGFAEPEALSDHAIRHLVEDHLAALVSATQRHALISEHYLWAAVADRCAAWIIWWSRQCKQHANGVPMVEALLRRLPLRGKTGALVLEHCGHCDIFLQRSACCFNYAYPGEQHCSTCPRLSAEERLDRLRERMAQMTGDTGSIADRGSSV